jgi:hypothetical protein
VRKPSKARLGEQVAGDGNATSDHEQAGDEHRPGNTGFVPVPDSLRESKPK